jgi:hypothetical protein|tara:strand:- start:274 stop:552 length:279 start_codon:yes stop_codon:yes gene_type:complete
MCDTDIINSLADEPIRSPEFVSLATIMEEIPNMGVKTPATYVLYLYYNEGQLSDEEVEQVNKVIVKLKTERDAVTDKNIQYMERDKHLIKEE